MTEFKEALIKFQGFDKTFDDEEIFQLDSQTILTIRRALLLADKLMQEPSKGMIKAAYDCVPERPQPMETEGRFSANNALRIKEFKAMRDQLIREIEQGSKCSHEGDSFKEHGRCCPHCGEFLTDFGD